MASLIYKVQRQIASLLNRLPHVRVLHKQSVEFSKNSCFPPGHFYSPIVSVDKIREREHLIWKDELTDKIPGIDLNTEFQKKLVGTLSDHYPSQPFQKTEQVKLRYYFENHYYSYTDGLILHCMMRHFQPKQIIEAGSGFSSAVMLDTNENFLNKKTRLTFIEPYPDRLNSLLTTKDRNQVIIKEQNIQDVNLDLFDQLENDDFLFIDSTHISKTDSDVNFILFEILPRLKDGVIIHFHDIFYPFEYPREWVYEGRNWNENYILKSFLMYNRNYEILLFSDYLHRFHSDAFAAMPLTYQNFGGNIWLRKIREEF